MSGTTCFINRGRVCGVDCRAYNQAASDCHFLVMAHTALELLGAYAKVSTFTITGTSETGDRFTGDHHG